MLNLKSKVQSAAFSTLVLGVGGFLIGLLDQGVETDFAGVAFIFVIMMYTGVGNVVYGIPVSLLSDWISNKLPAFRFIIAAFVHLAMAVATIVAIGEFYLFAVVAATLFFIAEEWQQRKHRTFHMKKAIVNGLLLILLFLGIWQFSQLDFREKTDNVYLIPEGYEGTVVVIYNVPGEPELEEENGRTVIPLHKAEQEYTYVGDVVHYVEGRTSSDISEGVRNDLYYYTDSQGKRTEIDEQCVHRGKSGLDKIGETEVDYEVFQVTNTTCGLPFMTDGSTLFEQQEGRIWMELFE